MVVVYPPLPSYPLGIDSDYTLFLVHNTTESILVENNQPWSTEVAILPVAANKDEIWPENGFGTIEGELFYYDAVEKDINGKINKLKNIARNLDGKETKYNTIGTPVRGMVVAEHHNQLVKAIVKIENFVGENFSTNQETLDFRIRCLREVPAVFDDFDCPDVEFYYTTASYDASLGTLINYYVTINGNFTSYRLDFGDGSFTNTVSNGQHRYAVNSVIDPVITISNSSCQIVVSGAIRENPQEPTPPVDSTFEIPIPEIIDFPNITPQPIEVPPVQINLPPVVFPCLDVGPIGPISVPSTITITPPIPSVINVDFPAQGPISVSIQSPDISPIQIEVPEFPNIKIDPISSISIDIPDFPPIEFIPPTFPSIPPIEIIPPVIPPIEIIPPVIPPIEISPIPPIDIDITISVDSPSIPPITITPPNIPPITIEPPNISPITIEPPEFPPIIVTPPNFPPITITPPSIPPIYIEPPTFPPITVEPPIFPPITIEPPNFPTIQIEPPNFPNIQIDPPNIPPIEINPPNIPPIEINPPTFPPITVTPPNFPPITITPPSIPSIPVSPPTIPPINITVPEIPPINITVPDLPPINIDPPNLSPIIIIPPSIPSIKFGPAPKLGPVLFGPAPSISPVGWQAPPKIECIVTVQCPSSSGFAARSMAALNDEFQDSFETDALSNIDAGTLGIPSEIIVIPPNIPNIQIEHDIPPIIRVHGPKEPIPSEIFIVNKNFPSVIEVSLVTPKSIALDINNFPSSIQLVTSPDFPSRIILDASEIPDSIKVVGVPDVIKLEGPKEIMLKLPEKPEVELIYKGGPIQLELKPENILPKDDSGAQCVMIVPCNK